MKTNKLPQSEITDSQAAGSQSTQTSQLNTRYLTSNERQQTGHASNESDISDVFINTNLLNHYETVILDSKNDVRTRGLEEVSNNGNGININTAYKKPSSIMVSEHAAANEERILQDDFEQCRIMSNIKNHNIMNSSHKNEAHNASPSIDSNVDIPERVFMNGLIKHTAIALAIIVPLAAFSAYAAEPQAQPMKISSNVNTADVATTDKTTTDKNNTATLAVIPSSIIYKSATTPTTVDKVNLEQYAGTWYEIGRLPMYFQRNCARDVTATYTREAKTSITVLNQCTGADGAEIKAEGLAKPADTSGSKLKVTFLPSWIRWLPVGRADYWVLAHDSNYQTALVGTPNKKYLWLLARSPDISQQTYTKYRQIAQQQGYDLKEFNLTLQTKRTVNLVP